jgi:hypothetical protein
VRGEERRGVMNDIVREQRTSEADEEKRRDLRGVCPFQYPL